MPVPFSFLSFLYNFPRLVNYILFIYFFFCILALLTKTSLVFINSDTNFITITRYKTSSPLKKALISLFGIKKRMPT